MVIWVIGRNYPLPDNGMQGSFELEQAKMLKRYGNEVYYLACSLHPIKRIKKNGIQMWEDDGVKVIVLSAFYAPRIYPVYWNRGRIKKWKKLFDETRTISGIPDVIHIHYPAMLMIADALKEYHKRGVRIVATEHWTKVLNKNLDSIETKEYKKYISVLDQMICVGSPLKASVKELTGMDGIIVPNVVNTLFKPADREHKGFRFVAVGRLIKLKQFDKIIDAFCDCFLGQKNITLTIVGAGPEARTLRKLIESRQAESQVKLLGNQIREKTADIISNSDNLICYSLYETFGVPIIEAWACGLNTITSNTAAAVVDYFDDRLGVVVDYRDYDGLKKALQFVYEYQKKYDRDYISDYASNRFSEAAIYKRLMSIYSGV